MKKIKLPERLYYPLPEAAEFLGCSVRDIYHYCATGMITLSVYLRGIESKDVGYMSLDLGSSEVEPDKIRKGVNLNYPGSYIHGIHYEKQDSLESELSVELIKADYIDGFFIVYSTDCYLLELSSDNFLELTGVTSLSYDNEEDGVSIYFENPLSVSRDSLCILSADINQIVQVDELTTNSTEHPRTANRKGEIIPDLLKMIPEFKGVDIESESASKILNILEAAAASRGIDLNIPDKNTWGRYLGRSSENPRRCRRK